jgi:L-2-hydroxyglutarate oxidase LhgO
MMALQAEVEGQGGAIVLNSRVEDVVAADDGIGFKVGDDGFSCKTLVNSAGLGAQAIASHLCSGAGSVPPLHPAKGHYFSYQGKSPFNYLVYPLPADGGLGIHATNDLGGAARFGPDVTWVDDIDYNFDACRKPVFVNAIRRYFPALDEEKLVPAYTGIRPKLYGAGEPPADFVIECEANHGVRGLVNLFGIESPGLTASLAIAEYVKKLA